MLAIAVITPAVMGVSSQPPSLMSDSADLSFYYEERNSLSETDSFGTVGSSVNADGMLEIKVQGTSDDLMANEVTIDSATSGGDLTDAAAYTANTEVDSGDSLTLWVTEGETVSVTWVNDGETRSDLMGEFTIPDYGAAPNVGNPDGPGPDPNPDPDPGPDDPNPDPDPSPDDPNPDPDPTPEEPTPEEPTPEEPTPEEPTPEEPTPEEPTPEDPDTDTGDAIVDFQGNGNAQVENVDDLSTTEAVIWVEDGGTIETLTAEVDSQGSKNIRPVTGGVGNTGTIAAVYLNATDTTYVHPNFDPTTGKVSPPGGDADPVCAGVGGPNEVVDSDGSCIPPSERTENTNTGDGDDGGNGNGNGNGNGQN